MRPASWQVVAAGLLVASFGSGVARAQYFGKNKIDSEQPYQVFETTHFDVYHDPGEAHAARLIGELAERWHARFTRALEHDLQGRQALILYGSQPEFAQTRVIVGSPGEGVGGITEFARRRIVMPFAPTLAETNQVLGHEIAHAFQLDIGRQHRNRTGLPLWAIEGMAQYLSAGPAEAATSAWLRDAAGHDLIPSDPQVAARRLSPYQYGHAMWTYLADRFGEKVLRDVLKAGQARNFDERVSRTTGGTFDRLFREWREEVLERHRLPPEAPAEAGGSDLLDEADAGRLHLGPVLSPDGRYAVFFSERDRLSVDLFLADTRARRVVRKLATTAASPVLESLQTIRSSGAWNATGDRFMFPAVRRGRPVAIIVDTGGQTDRVVELPGVGQVISLAWSPDGGRFAFSALQGGLSDLFLYDLQSNSLRRLTQDAFADLQPAWSPDGSRVAFVSDRFSTNLSTLEFGPLDLAVLDLTTGAIRGTAAFQHARHLNPQWTPEGDSLYFLADPGGIANVYRLDLRRDALYQVTDVSTGVSGATPTSPAFSAARLVPALAFTRQRRGRFELVLLQGEDRLAGRRLADRPVQLAGAAPASGPAANRISTPRLRPYTPSLSLEAIGQPYVSSGSGALGGYVRGGGSLLFADLLGERQVGVALQAGSRLRDLAIEARFLNREHRWNWGAVAELEPSIRRSYREEHATEEGQSTVLRQTRYFRQTQVRLAGLLAYPLSRARRFEFSAGLRHARYHQDIASRVSSLETQRVLRRSRWEGSGGVPATVAEVSAAFVGDTAVFGPTSPILGDRYRFEVRPALGGLSSVRVLADYRRYLMPVKPYTVALRVVHAGLYGRDAGDARLAPLFAGSRSYVRGYRQGAVRCEPDAAGRCAAMEALFGRRLAVANVEMRFPIAGVLRRDIRYGSLPAEGFVFADAAAAWSPPDGENGAMGGRPVASAGAGIRVNAFGLPLEVAGLRALDPSARRWSLDVSFRPGF
jgi:hypothetical protein